jgi:pimeloyl-ACP methyl ester carboxylesterase
MTPTDVRAARPVVYVLHGLLGTAYGHFGAQIIRWADQLCVVPVDLPGHGRCPLDANVEYCSHAADYLGAIVQRFGAGRLVAASYLGSPLAMKYAMQHPDLVDSVVLTGFAPGLDRQVFLTWLSGFQQLAARNPELTSEYDRLHSSRWRETLRCFSRDVERCYEQRALVRPNDLCDLDFDLLIVNGSRKSVERDAAARASALGRRVQGQVIEGAGHIASHDAPDKFMATVATFWSKDLVQ